jgi:alkylation response protein AidB-like acyl-CoA dehydrogenase
MSLPLQETQRAEHAERAANKQERPAGQGIDYVALARELAADFARHADHYDRTGEFVHENIAALLRSGYTAMTVPTAHGGGGASLEQLCRAQEALAAGCGSTAWAVNMHVHGVALLNHLQDADLEWAYEEIVAGRGFLAGGFSEPGVGGNWWYPTSRATPVPGGYLLNGRKSFFTGFPAATILFLTGVEKDERGVDQSLGFLLPRPEAGIRIERPWEACGMRGTGSHSLIVEDLFIPVRYAVGRRGEIPLLFMRGVHWAWCSFAAVYVGIAAGALEHVIRVVRERHLKVLPKSLAHLPGVQFRVAEMKVKLEAARAALYQAAAVQPEGAPADPIGHYVEISLMKLATCRLAQEIVTLALEVMGGSGYIAADPIQRMYRDVAAGALLPPPADVALEWGGKHALGVPVLGEPRWGE